MLRFALAVLAALCCYQTAHAERYIIADCIHMQVVLMDDYKQVRIYNARCGREEVRWGENVYISKKAKNPPWTMTRDSDAREPKWKPRFVAGGASDNPLGVAALYLANGKGPTEYRIHGVADLRTIGQHVSSGCFGLSNQDIVDLYDKVGVGTKVVVIK